MHIPDHTIGVMVSVRSSGVLALLIRVTVKEILLIRIVITPVILSCNQQTQNSEQAVK